MLTTPDRRPAPSARLLLVGLAMLSLACRPAPVAERPSASRQAAGGRVNQSEALLRSAIARLQDLPNALDLDLQPPSVVLDARSSLDGGEILATLGPTEGERTGALNRLVVRKRNAGFQRDVQAGDIVRCYLLPDRETRTRMRETGELPGPMTNFEAVELRVAQVLGPDSLRVEQGLRLPTGIVRELGDSLPAARVAEMREAGIPDAANFFRNLISELDRRGAITPDGVALPEQVIGALPGIAWPFRVEVWRVSDDRMLDINTALNRYAAEGDPPFGWEPSADSGELDQLMQRINQWTRGRDQPSDWTPADLLATLEPTLRTAEPLAAYTSDDALRRATFAPYEGRLVQEAIWLRDISRWASGDRFDPVKRAEKLFDWVVRNVTLSESPRVRTNRPWQTLVAGRGGAGQRAWVFAGLCRQQQLPMVVLEFPQPTGAPWLWCGVLSEGQLYLFDPQLGLPVAGDAAGETIATLSAVQADPGLLRLLDLPDAPYPLSADPLTGARLNVVAEPMSLSWRAAELQTRMRADETLVLSVDADELAGRFKQAVGGAGLGEPRLWAEPFDFFRRRLGLGRKARNAQRLDFRPYAWRPVLWHGRTLHFRGLFETEEQARRKAQRSGDALYEAVNDHQRAARRYMDPSVRPSLTVLARVSRDKTRVYERAKVDATYWLGLLKHDQGAYKAARQWLENPALSVAAAAYLGDGVRYNRARALEAEGDAVAAARLLEEDTSPQRHGNRLRARRLRGRAPVEAAPQEPAEAPDARPAPAGDAPPTGGA